MTISMHNQDVIKACAELVKAGKKPTVGLVRATLLNKVPLAAVVKGIQQYQVNRKLGIVMRDDTSNENSKKSKDTPAAQATQHLSTCACENRVALLEQQLEKLTQQLIALQAQVQDLSGP
jgi:uncharacterized protein HemX